jgi:predicted house-cleaning noncanonical NTP pyrophosphatase (MazG superfamily)
MTIKKYDKLVRDKIPEIIFRNGSKPKVYIATHEEYITRLAHKLQEEMDEFTDNPCVEELADIQEVILSLADACGWDLERQRLTKNLNRGGFERRYILIEVDEDAKQS